ncbi:MAG TPA: hypothetical protein VFR01_09515, partial [Geobacterales bacterium]|nr:hypothetical protein [Geobacterales bacterium]
MSDRFRDMLLLVLLAAVLILFFSRILFTDKIIRAPDIIHEFYWWAKAVGGVRFADLMKIELSAPWDALVNSGSTTEGGITSTAFLYQFKLIFHFIPAPENVAWFIVFHLFVGAAGVYAFCRLIGTSRGAAFLAALIFALAPENASLINAGHVMKIATISFAPWVFYFFEKGVQKQRLIYFLTTSMVLAFQFFHTHWQIAFYTCLALAAYGVFRLFPIAWRSWFVDRREVARLVNLQLVMVLFFLSTVAISLVPLANWSRESNRGVASGANEGKGGLQVEEAMSWSLPPEELVSFVIPGFFGFSRQEGGENPPRIASYYWGRMAFTQTTDYMGLLPWLLVPLPLIFLRNRYTWLATGLLGGALLFSMGKYTPFYWALYEYFPGINHFRVPKMMMF